MTRRVALCATVALALTGIAGCPKKDTLARLVATLGNAVAQLATLTGNTQLADRIRHDVALATAALQNWQPGMPAADAIRALNQLIDSLKLFPPNDPFRPLITLALGTAAAIIDFINMHTSTPGERPHTDIKLTDPPKNEEEFKKTWDAIRAGSPGMEKAPVL